MRYRSKPVECEAMQVLGRDNAVEVRAFIQKHDPGPRHQDGYDWHNGSVWVTASQAWCDIDVGGYIIAERNGPGVYPCRRQDFEDRWDEVLIDPNSTWRANQQALSDISDGKRRGDPLG